MKRTSPESGLTTPSIAPLLFPLSQGAALVVLNGDGIILDTTWSTEKFKGGISSLAGSTGIHLGIFMSPNPFFWRAEASPDVAHVAHVVHTPGSRTVPRRTGRFASLQPSPFGEVLFGSSFRWYQVISRYGHLWRNHSKSTQHPNIMPYFPPHFERCICLSLDVEQQRVNFSSSSPDNSLAALRFTVPTLPWHFNPRGRPQQQRCGQFWTILDHFGPSCHHSWPPQCQRFPATRCR